MTRRHERPHDGELESAPVEQLIDEVRYLRHLIRQVGRSVRGLDPALMAAWKAEVKTARKESGHIDEPLEP